MKKIPCLFVREFHPRADGRGQDFTLIDPVTPGLEWVLAGDGIATHIRRADYGLPWGSKEVS